MMMVDDVDLHLVVDLDLEQRLLEGFHRTGVVALEDEVELAALLESLIQVLQRDTLLTTCLHRRTLTSVTLRSNLASHTVILNHEQVVARARNTVEALDLNRTGRACLFHVLAPLVDHATHATEVAADDNRVTDA